ncbi:MAG: dTDP-4-dehydrorhamnose reductase [Candidatus Eremiobacteraeota bacterium]|nr:dTDP-4-dehydrorhamnose reductase [Candidatus Eremiobacteraeota bacterium]
MRVLLFGGSGQLGSEIVRRWTDCTIVAPSSAETNVEDERAVAFAVVRNAPDVIVNCTAFHNVDLCQREPERAFAVNATAVERMARAARGENAAFVTFSTDYVFDGETERPYDEADEPNPLSQYGASKLEGERRVERLEMAAFVVRTCGLYATRISSSKGYTFVDRVLERGRAGEPQQIVSDSFASPTYAANVAVALRGLLATTAYGLYHAANEGAVSWFDFAAEALRRAGVDGPLEPISREAWKPETPRPRFSALASERLAALGIPMPTWAEGLGDYLRDKL